MVAARAALLALLALHLAVVGGTPGIADQTTARWRSPADATRRAAAEQEDHGTACFERCSTEPLVTGSRHWAIPANENSIYSLFTERVLEAALTPWGYPGRACSLCGSLAVAVRERALRIAVLGGSFPAGHGLSPGQQPWPAQLAAELERLGWFANVRVHNFAQPATPLHVQTSMLFQLQPNLSTAHFVIVDSSANDRPSHKAFRNSRDAFAESTGAAAMDLLQSEGFLSKHASVLFLETFTEAQLLHPAHLPAQVNRTEYTVQRYTPSCFFDISTMFHWPELVKRGLPVLSYPDAICRAALTPEAHRTALWRRDTRGAKAIGLPHPGVFVHEVISKLVIAALSHASRQWCPASDSTRKSSWWNSDGTRGWWEAADTARRSGLRRPCHPEWVEYVSEKALVARRAPRAGLRCDTAPTSYMSVDDPVAFRPSASGQAWALEEDVPGKPGWISRGECDERQTRACTIEFEVETALTTQHGMDAEIRLIVLKSYEQMGMLRCRVSHVNATGPALEVWINSSWPARMSQAAVEPIVIPGPSKLQSHDGRLRLSCTAIGGKSKILAVRGC